MKNLKNHLVRLFNAVQNMVYTMIEILQCLLRALKLAQSLVGGF
jgi:hypothetical protein